MKAVSSRRAKTVAFLVQQPKRLTSHRRYHLLSTRPETSRSKFKGNDKKLSESAVTTPDSDPLIKTASGQSKRKVAKKVAAAATSTVVSNGSKSAEVLALETKIAEQGQAIRELKAQIPKTAELDAQIKAAVNILKALKTDLENCRTVE